MKKTCLFMLLILCGLYLTGCMPVYVDETQKTITDEVAINNALDLLQARIKEMSQSNSIKDTELERLFANKVIYNPSNFTDPSLSQELHPGEFLLTCAYAPLHYRMPKVLEYEWDQRARTIIIDKQSATVIAAGLIKAETTQFYYYFTTKFVFEKSSEGKWLIRQIGQLFPPELLTKN